MQKVSRHKSKLALHCLEHVPVVWLCKLPQGPKLFIESFDNDVLFLFDRDLLENVLNDINMRDMMFANVLSHCCGLKV